MDCQGLVARLVMDFVLLTTAVEVAGRWRELAERLAKVSRQQMEAYEAPHRDSRGQLDIEVIQTQKTFKETVQPNINTHLLISTVKYKEILLQIFLNAIKKFMFLFIIQE